MDSQGAHDAVYANRLEEERRRYDLVEIFDDLPPIYHYWSHTFVRPLLEPLGCSRPAEFFARYLIEGARTSAAQRPIFVSIGSGDANNELEIARLLLAGGVAEFTIECLEMNPSLIERAVAAAAGAGLSSHVAFFQQDFNHWQPSRTYQGVIANQSLHHVTNLEGLFDAIRVALAPNAYFVASDIIGRNGHQRWPEAKRLVDRFWSALPPAYRHHRQLDRYEETFQDWDCSSEGFEGIRSQDILALLLDRFYFHAFVGFGNLIDPFVDRGFGPNFDADATWDRQFVDRVQACDERLLLEGYLTPTHMMAAMSTSPSASPYYARGLAPQTCVRDPRREAPGGEVDVDIPEGLLADWSAGRLPLRGPVRQRGDARGFHEDGWVGEALEFTVVAEHDVSLCTLQATMPVASEAPEFSIEIDGTHVRTGAAGSSGRFAAPIGLARGETASVRIVASKTVNLKRRGLSDDERDLGFHVDAIAFEPAARAR